MLRRVVAEPASWFGCATQLSVLLLKLGNEIEREFVASQADDSHSPNRLMSISRAFLLLAGFATENYLKGLWVARNSGKEKAVPDRDPFLPKELGTHRLTKLAKGAGVSLDASQQSTLELLERSVIWYARYPVPMNPDHFQLFGSQSGEVQRIRSLVAHLRKRARDVMKKAKP
jgi:hypothetical protein